MIGIKIDSEYIDLPADLVLQVVGSNPAFDKDATARVFSYPFRVPATPNNLKVLSHNNRLDAKRRTETTAWPEVTLTLAGDPFEHGRLKIGEVTEDVLECSFGNTARNIIDDLGRLKIRSLMPVVNIPQTEEGHWVFSILPVTSPYEYRILINDHSYFYLADPGDTQFDAGAAVRDLINADYPGTAVLLGGDPKIELNAGTFDPYVVSTFSGFTLDSALTVGEAVQNNLLNYLDDLSADPVESHSFPMICHDAFYGAANVATYRGFVNYFHVTYGYNEPSVDKEWAYTYLPFVKVKYVFDQIAAQLDMSWAGDFYDSQDFADLRIFANYSLDKLRYEYFTSTMMWLNSFKISFNLALYVPDITAKDFMEQVMGLLNVYPVILGSTITMKRRRDQLTAKERDYSAYMTPAYKLSMTPTMGATLRFKNVQALQAISPSHLEDYVIGEGKNIMEFALHPLPDSFFSDGDGGALQLAWAYEKGSSDELQTGINPPPFRIFFDRGMQVDTEDGIYHMGTHLDTDINGDSIGDLSLEWDGDKGLYAQLWKGWVELQDASPLQCSAILPVSEARMLLFWDRPVVRFYHPMGHSRGIVQNIRFNARVDDSNYVEVNFEMLKY